MVLLASVLMFSRSGPPKSSEPLLTGQEIVNKMHAAVRAGSPIKGEMLTSGPRGQAVTMSFEIMYPALFSGKMTLFNFHTEMHRNASGFYTYMPDTNQYSKASKLPIPNTDSMGLYGLESLFGDRQPYQVAKQATTTVFGGKHAFAVPITMSPSITEVARGDTLFVDASTFLPLGFDEDDPDAGGIDHSVYKLLTLHAHLTKEDFNWSPPKGAKIMQPGR